MDDINVKLTRRTLIRTIATASGGLLLGFRLPGAVAAVVAPEPWTTPTGGEEINAWLAIDADGTVTIRVPHTEQGQGALTSVAMLIAEELDVSWDDIQVVFADMNRHVNRGGEYKVTITNGSRLVRQQHPHIMQAGASARERLKAAAAEAWGVSTGDITASQGTLTSGANKGTYAEFARAAAGITLPAEPEIKKPGTWWLLGTPTARLDADVKSNGSAHFSIDTHLDGMVFAAVKSCPVPWGKLASYDFDAIKERAGVIRVVEFRAVDGKRQNADLQDGVAVVAESWYQAKMALDALPIEWDTGPEGEVSLFSQGEEAAKLLETTGDVSGEHGADAAGIIASADRTVTAEYHRPWETHARMEPINATVSVTDERIDVWSPMQDQAAPVMVVADQLGRDKNDIYVHTGFIGGAFGGNGGGATAVTRQAAVVSATLGRPAKVIWSREEDFMQDKQRPPVYSRLSAALGDDGLPTALTSRAVWFTHGGAENVGPATADYSINTMPYAVPNRRHERHNVATHIPTTTHRGPGANQNGFMIEQFVDEMALAADLDPLEWRLKMTEGQEPWQRVLLKLKEVSGFTTDLPQGQGMGLAIVEDHASICGACATVSVTQAGELTVEKVVVAINSGYIINPRGATEQIQGAVAYELSHALYGGMGLENGQFTTRNFDTYKLMRIHQMPEVDVQFALSEDGWWGGVAEPGGPPVPPAVANAIYYATGKRIRSTPINKHDLTWS